jgi:hypothetical protein
VEEAVLIMAEELLLPEREPLAKGITVALVP